MKVEGTDLTPKMIDLLGGRTRTRTWDPLIKSQLLYQLSYAPEMPAAVGPQGAASCSKASSHCPARPARTCVICSVCLKILPSVRPREGHPATLASRGPVGGIRAADRVLGSRVSLRSPGTRSRGFPLEFTPAQAGAGMSGVLCAAD